MSETDSSSTREILVYDSGCDRLSELPSSIIEAILSLLPIKEVVRTSVLSKQFRHTWTRLLRLVFDQSEFRSIECMDKFIASVLNLHKGPVHRFSISLLLKQSWPTVDKWLLEIPENEICELILKFQNDQDVYQMISVPYLFRKLTCLELLRCELDPPPVNFAGFSFLKCLILVNVTISRDDVESIVDNSPLIETLKLHHNWTDRNKPELRINAPNLKYLDLETYTGTCLQIYLSAPILDEIRLAVVQRLYHYLAENRPGYNYANFFDSCTHLQKLSGNFFNKVMSYGVDSGQYSFALPHLKFIELNHVQFGDLYQISMVVRLVTGAPNLEELKLNFEDDYYSKTLDNTYIDSFFAPNFKWEKLKTISIWNLASLPSPIQFLKLLLENSPVLEKMKVVTYGLVFKEVTNLRAEILNCDLASPNFTLLFG